MAFDATWSMGNIITITVTVVGGIFAFNRIVNTLGAGLKDQSAAIAILAKEQEAAVSLLAAHQEAAISLLAQSVAALDKTASAMQGVLAEQQKQLSTMAVETEITRRLREEARRREVPTP
jgi:ABC-type transporter Mla subunit MlaD